MSEYIFVIIPIIFFLLMAFVFGGSANSSAVQQDINAINCPMPAGSGLWNNTGTIMYQNGTYNYHGVNNRVNTLTCSGVHTLDGFDYFYGSQAGLSFAGVPFFISDYLAEGVYKLGALVHMIGLNLIVPQQLNTHVSAPIFFFIYMIMYIMLAIGLFVVFNPFKGG